MTAVKHKNATAPCATGGMIPLERLLSGRDVSGKRCLLRIDLNVRIEEKQRSSRLEQHGKVVKMLQDAGVKTLILSHMGRPKGSKNDADSLRHIATYFADHILKSPIKFLEDYRMEDRQAKDLFHASPNGSVTIGENIRFYHGEESNDASFAKHLASFGDFYVCDAFSVVHRSHASVARIQDFLPSFAGPTLIKELNHLTDTLYVSDRPLMVVFGGAKVDTKFPALNHLIGHVDTIVVTGTLACLLLSLGGANVSVNVTDSTLQLAKDILHKLKKHGQKILLPVDGIFMDSSQHIVECSIKDAPSGAAMLDIGEKTCSMMINQLKNSKTLIWNGPLGMYEKEAFAGGTRAFSHAVSGQSRSGHLSTLIGGGDTEAALRSFGYDTDLFHVSTGGGSMLDWLAGRPLPGVLSLEKASSMALSFLRENTIVNIDIAKEKTIV